MAGEEGEASAARKLSTATSILARTYRQRNRTRESPQQKAPEEEMGEAEKVLASGGARMSAEQRRLSAAQRRRATPPPRSPPPSVDTLRLAAEASRQVVCCRRWQMGWAELGK